MFGAPIVSLPEPSPARVDGGRDEYDKLHKVIAKRFPGHLAEFVVSVHTGMRLAE